MRKPIRWATHLVLAAGAALRIGLAVVTPPDRAYDDHYEPVQVILNEGRIPSAADCWECYQPPLYYLLSAGLCAITQPAGVWLSGQDVTAEHIGRRTLQFLSVVAGCATLWACRLLLRWFPPLAAHEALALSLPAFLPQHLYMSAMGTNDALTYLLATLAVCATLRAQQAGWAPRGCVMAGLLAGSAVLCKGYGWMTVAAIAAATWWFTRRAGAPGTDRLRREVTAPLLLVVASALVLAIWPSIHNIRVYDTPLVDNFSFWPETPMRHQPPGSVRATSFFSFRPGALLKHPWLHMTHVDSFWTEFYGRLWFDYEGFRTTLDPYPPWQLLWERAARAHPLWNRARWEMLLSYAPGDVPPDFRRVAVISYLIGLPLTLAVLIGLVAALRKLGRDFGWTLVTVHGLLALAVPVFQTLRLPHFAAMKAGFALSGLAAGPVLVGLVLSWPRGRAARVVVVGLAWMLSVALAAADAAYVLLQAGRALTVAG